jgi:hypothetical protein
MWYLLIPVGALVGYELWTHALYGQSLLLSAVHFAHANRGLSRWSRPLAGLSFTGGCALSVLALCPLMWSRRVQGIVAAASALAASALILGWIKVGRQFVDKLIPHPLVGHWELIGSQLTLFIAGGVFTLALAITDYWKKRDSDSLLLGLWVVGTFFFTIRLNWTVNARSVLPLIPAAAILAVRRLEIMHDAWTRSLKLRVAGALIVSGVLSIWVAAADTHLANLARAAAQNVRSRTSNEVGTLWYGGHWGFQYYMEQLGALPVDALDFQIRPGDFVAVPENNARLAGFPPDMSFQKEAVLELPNPSGAAVLSWQLGAGFYSSYWGPLPFAFGPAPPERYTLMRASPVR